MHELSIILGIYLLMIWIMIFVTKCYKIYKFSFVFYMSII